MAARRQAIVETRIEGLPAVPDDVGCEWPQQYHARGPTRSRWRENVMFGTAALALGSEHVGRTLDRG